MLGRGARAPRVARARLPRAPGVRLQRSPRAPRERLLRLQARQRGRAAPRAAMLTAAGQVCLSYGEKSNDVLALSYFFCLPDNPDDVYWLDDWPAAAAAAGLPAARLVELTGVEIAGGGGRRRRVQRGAAAEGSGGCEVRRHGIDSASFIQVPPRPPLLAPPASLLRPSAATTRRPVTRAPRAGCGTLT